MRRAATITVFCRELRTWFARHKRTLPWRDLAVNNIDHKAYLVLVSEIMLQQTQVSRVIILYKKFIHQFPHIKGLARASNKEILVTWRGLGYNNRALRLRDAAKEIVEEFDGRFPTDMEELQDLPGVGHYTAGAVRNFAFGIPTSCMDVNIRRILHRFFVGIEHSDGTWKASDAELLKISELTMIEALEQGMSSADFFAALMDFGSLVCTKHNPKWDQLSPAMKSVCKAYGKTIDRTKRVAKKEPGRLMAGKFVPNRIFRGKVIETLRDAEEGLTLEEVGKRAIADWTMGNHRKWLDALLAGLANDRLIRRTKTLYTLG